MDTIMMYNYNYRLNCNNGLTFAAMDYAFDYWIEASTAHVTVKGRGFESR